MDVDFPFNFDGRGRTAETAGDAHIRDLIEQVLFTAPGERVNRPTFGCGLAQLVFTPNSDELAAATQYLVHGALQQWLGDLIQVEDVLVENVMPSWLCPVRSFWRAPTKLGSAASRTEAP